MVGTCTRTVSIPRGSQWGRAHRETRSDRICEAIARTIGNGRPSSLDPTMSARTSAGVNAKRIIGSAGSPNALGRVAVTGSGSSPSYAVRNPTRLHLESELPFEVRVVRRRSDPSPRCYGEVDVVVVVVAVLAEVVVVLGVAALVVAEAAPPLVSGIGTRYAPVGSTAAEPGTR